MGRRWGRSRLPTPHQRAATLVAGAFVLVASVLIAAGPGHAAPAPTGGAAVATVPPPEVGTAFQPLPPARLYDSRPGATTVDGQQAGGGKVVESTYVTVANRGGLPAYPIAVVLNVTALEATAPTYLTVAPTPAAAPTTSSLNLTPGQIASNLVVVPLSDLHGGSSAIAVRNHAGTVDLVVDVFGWFPYDSGFDPIVSSRVADTRPGAVTADGRNSGSGPVTPGAPLTIDLAGRVGVPASGATAVLVNITGTAASTSTFLAAHAAGQPRPATSNVNLEPTDTIARLAVVPLSSTGAIAISNEAGAVDVVVDVLGSFDRTSDYPVLSPARLVDTRPGQATVDGQQAGTGRIGAGASLDVTVAGRAGVPPVGAAAAIVNITVPDADAVTFITAYATGSDRPGTSNLNPYPSTITSNLAVVPLSPDGRLRLHNAAGTANLVVDVFGWLPASESGAATPAGSWHPPADRVPTSGTYAYIQSSPGELYASGTSRLFTPATAGRIEARTTSGGFAVYLEGDIDWWGWFTLPGGGGAQLAPGIYDDLPGDESGVLGMEWNQHLTCSNTRSWLAVDDIHYSGELIDRLALRFEQRCVNVDGTLQPALRGAVVIDPTDTTRPPVPVSPVPPLLWRPPAGAIPAGTSAIFVDSPPDSFVGAGFVGLMTGDVSTIGGPMTHSLGVSVDGGGSVRFSAMDSIDRIEPGFYPALQRDAFRNRARGGLDFGMDGRGCNQVDGWVVVDAVTYVGDVLQSIDLRFGQRCWPSDRPLHGALHWQRPA